VTSFIGWFIAAGQQPDVFRHPVYAAVALALSIIIPNMAVHYYHNVKYPITSLTNGSQPPAQVAMSV